MNSPKGKMFRVTMTTQPWEILCDLQAPIARYLVAEPNLLPAARPPAANTRAPPELRLPRLSQEAQPPSVVMQVPPLPVLRFPRLPQENSPHRRSCRRPRCRSCVSPSCHRRRSPHWQPPSAVMQVPSLPELRLRRLPQETRPPPVVMQVRPLPVPQMPPQLDAASAGSPTSTDECLPIEGKAESCRTFKPRFLSRATTADAAGCFATLTSLAFARAGVAAASTRRQLLHDDLHLRCPLHNAQLVSENTAADCLWLRRGELPCA